MVAVAGSFFGN